MAPELNGSAKLNTITRYRTSLTYSEAEVELILCHKFPVLFGSFSPHGGA